MGMDTARQMPASLLSAAPDGWVVCLCAQWCGVCREYRGVFDELATRWPHVRFEWVDVEDEEDVVGDVDVETFPTVLIAGGGAARFLGPVLPQANVLCCMLQGFAADTGSPVPDARAQALFERIAASR